MMTRRNHYRLLLLGLLLLALAGAAFWRLRPQPAPFEPLGGKYFSRRILLDVPLFLQNDPRWADDEIGDSGSRMASEGCVVASAAMLLRYYGIDTNPERLNRHLSRNQGYTKTGRIYWNKIAEVAGGRLRFSYAGAGSPGLIDAYLTKRNPVIVKVFIRGVVQHWVLVVGKEGREYLINDPLRLDGKGTRLSDYESKIYAVRVFSPTEE